MSSYNPKTKKVVNSQFDIPKVPKEKVVDSNGCGDSFVGAFIASLAAGKSTSACVKNGIALSGQIVQNVGCTLPGP